MPTLLSAAYLVQRLILIDKAAWQRPAPLKRVILRGATRKHLRPLLPNMLSTAIA